MGFSSSCTVEQRKFVFKLTSRAVAMNQQSITSGGKNVSCPLNTPGSRHICYLSTADSGSAGDHAGRWSREFLQDFLPPSVIKTRAGETADSALARILQFEKPDVVEELLDVQPVRAVIDCLDSLADLDDPVISADTARKIIREASKHPLRV